MYGHICVLIVYRQIRRGQVMFCKRLVKRLVQIPFPLQNQNNSLLIIGFTKQNNMSRMKRTS
jgi:hypothetical protein